MRVGIPKEIKPQEGRVGLIPAAAGELVRRGHTVCVETGAGEGSGFSDADYSRAGVDLVPDARAVYETAELVVKVKEPIGDEPELLRAGQRLFCFLHLAAAPELVGRLQQSGVTAIAFETVEEHGSLPILAPMSDIAGRLSVMIGARLLHRPEGGKGLLLGGLPAAERGQVVVLGAGKAGGNAARLAGALGARVTVFDKNPARLGEMRALGANVTALYPFGDHLADAVATSDLLIGAVLIPGAKAPHLVSEAMIETMARGSVVVDISIDQGGCIETIHPTTHAEPGFMLHGVTHVGVTNLPGAVPRSASEALCASMMPYLLGLLEPDWREMPALAAGINIEGGRVIHPALRDLYG